MSRMDMEGVREVVAVMKVAVEKVEVDEVEVVAVKKMVAARENGKIKGEDDRAMARRMRAKNGKKCGYLKTWKEGARRTQVRIGKVRSVWNGKTVVLWMRR